LRRHVGACGKRRSSVALLQAHLPQPTPQHLNPGRDRNG
jgi:hypothetical protein